MALPRFHRLDESERSRILSAAADHISAHEAGEWSLLDVATAADLSRSAMYNYFDGRDDLLDTVRTHAHQRAVAALGVWQSQSTREGFWSGFHSGSERLRTLLADAPALRPLLGSVTVVAGSKSDADSLEWVIALVENAALLGLVPEQEVRLALPLTFALLAVIDHAELENPGSISAERVERMLTATWGAIR